MKTLKQRVADNIDESLYQMQVYCPDDDDCVAEWVGRLICSVLSSVRNYEIERRENESR